ncbi:MAG: hypothetical protein R3300_20505 [Candidatus Promineifilaceae bacterium]|nr:hypothetical protein [Candidatus Promineifilaceae bacterium]
MRQVRFLVEPIGWQIGLYLLLFSLAMLLLSRQSADAYQAARPSRSAYASALLLLAAGMLSVWAATASALLISWTLLIASWGLFQWSLHQRPGALLRRIAVLGISLLFLALAGASLPLDQQSTTLPLSSWPESSTFWAVIAAAVMLGTVPFHGWRTWFGTANRALAIMGILVPWAGAASLLARLELSTSGSSALLLLTTALGVLGLLRGSIVAWDDSTSEGRVFEGLTQAQAGFILLAASWAGASGTSLEIRVAWLALGALFASNPTRVGSLHQWQRLIGFVAALALLGAPLTAAFAGRAALYDALLDSGGLVLLMVLFLLTAPFGAAALWRAWHSPAALNRAAERDDRQQHSERAAALILLLVGMVSAPTTVNPLAAGAILVGIVAALLLTGFSRQLQSTEDVLRRAFRIEVRLASATRHWKQIVRAAGSALREAETILETEGGLAWFVVLLIIVLLATQIAL